MMTIFIIDDDPLFVRKLQFQLEASGNHTIHTFNTSERAAGQLLSLKPEVIFLDHYLGGIAGTEIIPLILEKLPHCKIISISSQDDIKIMEQALNTGAYRYIKKDNCFSEKASDLMEEIESGPKQQTIGSKIGDFLNKTKKREKPLIFIVDDDEVFNFMVQYKLEAFEEYELETFAEGIKAMTQANRKPDILVLDYNLKGMKGSVVLGHYRKESPKTKIIIVSSQKEIDIALKLIEMGADDYIMKGENLLENLKTTLKKNLN